MVNKLESRLFWLLEDFRVNIYFSVEIMLPMEGWTFNFLKLSLIEFSFLGDLGDKGNSKSIDKCFFIMLTSSLLFFLFYGELSKKLLLTKTLCLFFYFKGELG